MNQHSNKTGINGTDQALSIDNLILHWIFKTSNTIWQKVKTYSWAIIIALAIAFIFYKPLLVSTAITIATIIGIFALIILTLWVTSFLGRIFFGCQVCESTGVVNGHDMYLDINFNKNQCYACNGKRLMFKKKNDWYNTAMNAVTKMRKHRQLIDEIKRDLGNYQSTIKISPGLVDKFIKKRYQAQKKSLSDALALEEAQYELFQVIHQRAILMLHKQHLHLLQNRWDKRIKLTSEHKFDTYSKAISASEDIGISTLFEDEFTSLNQYLESFNDSAHNADLLQDIRQATERLKADNKALKE
jgi:hypothetical protein